MIAFGIGCFHFGLNEAPTSPLKAKKYVETLTESLGSIKSISSIKADCPETVSEEIFEVSGPIPDMGDGDGCFPYLSFFELSFEIYIPFRVQAEILERPQEQVDTTTEHFGFTLINNYDGPVVFVECIKAKREAKPSDAVIILREFLKKELKTQSTRIRIETLGPSPFHADCFLLPQQHASNELQGRSLFYCEQKHLMGYDEITFHYNARITKSEIDVKNYLFQTIAGELDLFYEIKRNKVSQMNDWEAIESQLQQLIALQRHKGCRGWVKKIIKRGHMVNELMYSLSEFNSQNLFLETILKKSYADQYNAKDIF